MDSQEPTQPRQTEVTPIEHAYATLLDALNTRGLDQRTRVMAAQGIVDYELASQIGHLITLMTQPMSLIDYSSQQPQQPGEPA